MDLHQDPAADHQYLGPGVDARLSVRDAGPSAAVGPDGIRARYGSEVDIPIAWNDVYSVARRKQAIQDKQPKVTIDDNDVATLHMRIQNETNIEVRLDRPVPLKLPHGTETVSQSSSTPTIGSGSSKPFDATFKGTRFAFADVSTDDRLTGTRLEGQLFAWRSRGRAA